MHNPFKPPRFYPIIDTAVLAATSFSPIEVAEEAAAAGVHILQYRHKEHWTQAHFDEAERIAQICEQAGTLFVMNDRADFAKLLNAGLHIGQDDLPPVAARAVTPNAILGFSTHNAIQLRRAEGLPVDYLSLGPIFATSSKQRPDPVVGVDGLRALRMLAPKPVVAIGGITRENAIGVFNAGADSVAVISGFLPDSADRGKLKRSFEDWLSVTKDV